MGNASGRDDGEGSSGVKDAEGYEQQEDVEFPPHGWWGARVGYHEQGSADAEPEAMLHSPPLSPRAFQQPPLMFNPQVPLVPSSRLSGVLHAQNYASTHSTTYFRDVFMEKPIPVLIVWSYGGQQVAVTGSWDNWNRSEPLQRSGKDFVLIKMLPLGVYHYRFIVDEHLRCAPDLPLEFDDSGTGFNILDVQCRTFLILLCLLQYAVQDHVPEAPDSLSEFESPSSPPSSYNNQPLTEADLSKPPPEMPPHLQLTPPQLQSTFPYEQYLAVDGHELLPKPRQEMLNHLYIQRRDDLDSNCASSDRSPVALASTHRFLQKYVTVVIYKPKRR